MACMRVRPITPEELGAPLKREPREGASLTTVRDLLAREREEKAQLHELVAGANAYAEKAERRLAAAEAILRDIATTREVDVNGEYTTYAPIDGAEARMIARAYFKSWESR